jgi:hypothetical protein
VRRQVKAMTEEGIGEAEVLAPYEREEMPEELA